MQPEDQQQPNPQQVNPAGAPQGGGEPPQPQLYPPHQAQQPPVQQPGNGQQYQAASQMKHDHSKQFLIGLIVMSVLFVGTAIFAIWAFMERQEYKDNVDGIVASEVESAVAENTEQLEAEFIEREKEPLTSYTSPSAFGSVRVEYPKTWSAYIEESDSGSTPIEGYFHPNYVPDPGDHPIALTVEVIDRGYDRELGSYESAARRDRVTITPIEAENVDGVVGSRVDGEISRGTQGSVVLFELRDKTLVLTTESTEFIDDFDNIILANLSFNP